MSKPVIFSDSKMHVRIARCFRRSYCTRSGNHLPTTDLLKLVEKEDVLSLQAVREQQTKIDYQALFEYALEKNKLQSVDWLLKTQEPTLHMQLLEQVAEDCSLECIKVVLEHGLVDMNSFMEAIFRRADKEIIDYILSFYDNPKLLVSKLIENDKVELLPYYLDKHTLWVGALMIYRLYLFTRPHLATNPLYFFIIKDVP